MTFHRHRYCPLADDHGFKWSQYREWRSQIELAPRNQCYRCGLPQSICHAIEERSEREYLHLVFPVVWFLWRAGTDYFGGLCRDLGFPGGVDEWQWEWMNQESEGSLGWWELNWLRVFRRIEEVYTDFEARDRA
jgi:hypothetical protein